MREAGQAIEEWRNSTRVYVPDRQGRCRSLVRNRQLGAFSVFRLFFSNENGKRLCQHQPILFSFPSRVAGKVSRDGGRRG